MSKALVTSGAGRLLGAALGLGFALSAHALTFKLADGAIEGAFDSTFTYGISWAAESPERHMGPLESSYGTSYGRRAYDKWEIFSKTFSGSHELELRGRQWGFFTRGNYFYDFEADDLKVPDAAENRLVQHGDLTDFYGLYRWGADDQFMARLGKQVISWGENTFIPGAINDINTVDISKLRQPGSEIKNALVGTPSLYGSWAVNEALTAEAFVLFGYDEVKIDPMGSFFSTNDRIVDGGGFANAPSGPFFPTNQTCIPPDGPGVAGATPPHNHTFSCSFGPITRAKDDIPSSGGQFGFALHYLAPELLNGFDFGLYYQKLHDHNPNLSAVRGTLGPAFVGPRPYYYLDYAEDVERYGLSLNTIVGPWALGSEFSYRRNAPIQNGLFIDQAVGSGPYAAVPMGKRVEGFERYQRYQIQATVQRLWGPMPEFRADQWNTLIEAAYGWTGGVPDTSATFKSFDPVTNDFSKLVMLSVLTYNNALLNRINMEVRTAFAIDIHGVSPELGGAAVFVDGRKSASLGFDFDYAQRWRWGISRTWLWGDNERRTPSGLPLGTSANSVPATVINTGTDRDFVTVSVSYSF